MSEVKNKVKWCLKKAEKELQVGSKHRGLVEIKPDLDEAKKHIIKAEHNFKALISFEKTGFSDWSVSAGFYAIYHCFLAILAKQGFESRNQECTIALIEALNEDKKIEVSPDIIDSLKTLDADTSHERNAIELRENFQYGTETSIDDKRLTKLKDLCKKAIEEAKKAIY